MKQKSLLKKLFLLCALIAGNGSAWGAELELDLSSATGWTINKSGTSGTGGEVEMSKDGITLTASKGYWASNQLRVYSGSTFVVTSNIGNMSEITLTYSDKTGPLSNYTNGTATISPSAPSLSSSASGQARITKIVITYEAISVANPIFSPASSAVEKGTVVTISTSTVGANIYYTNDGSTPTSESTLYSSALTINEAQTIKAIAIKGDDKSSVITATYSIKKVVTPVFSEAEGTVLEGTTVEIETETEGATIYYTTDGTTPTISSSVYSTAISIDNDITIKAIAIMANWDDSDIASVSYTVVPAVKGLSVNFETNDVLRYSDWSFNNIGIHSSGITAHDGTYWGHTSGKSSAYVQTKNKIQYPNIFTCYISKESDNTNASSNWKIQTSSNGSDWSDVKTQSATGMEKGVWQEFSADLTSYINVYVRLYYGGSTAVRAVDDIVLTELAQFTINDACTDGANYYGTYSNSSAFVVPAGLTVSAITGTSGATLTLDNYTTGDVVPANTGVLVSSTTAGEKTVVLTNEAGTVKTGNMLKPSSETMTGDYLFYRLTMHKGSQLGFWWGAEDGAAFDIAANKAYLAVPTAGAREGFTFDEDVTTAISEECRVKSEEFATAVMYDLQGRRVEKATKGLYIRNGRKVFVK